MAFDVKCSQGGVAKNITFNDMMFHASVDGVFRRAKIKCIRSVNLNLYLTGINKTRTVTPLRSTQILDIFSATWK